MFEIIIWICIFAMWVFIGITNLRKGEFTRGNYKNVWWALLIVIFIQILHATNIIN
jgi:hypothetical protein